MTDDATFRLALLAAACIVIPVGMYHRIRSLTAERLDRRREGWFILLTLRPVGLSLIAGTMLYLIEPAWMRWASLPLPPWLRWGGIALFALAGALLGWTLHRLGRNLTDTVVTRRDHTLVTRGPYRWVRHPFYDAVGLLTAGAALAAANWFLLAGAVAVFSLFAIRTRIEEQQLLARFGEPYRRYLEQTGRFVPKIAGRRNVQTG
jgi:protein-S-isoprenylcysteine O-methyltransferase Ste14